MRTYKPRRDFLSVVIDSEVMKIDKKSCEYVDDYDLFDDKKELAKFVKRLKSYIRKSYEYKRLIQFLKRHKKMNICGVHFNIKSEDGYQINIHHTPFVLEDICYTVIAKRYKANEPLTMSAIAEEIMMLHYLGLIGLYPLCETCHSYAHSDENDLFIPFNVIFGEVMEFFDIYKEFMTEDLQRKFENIVNLNKGYEIIETNIPTNLMRHYIYITDKDGTEHVSMTKLYNFIKQLLN